MIFKTSGSFRSNLSFDRPSVSERDIVFHNIRRILYQPLIALFTSVLSIAGPAVAEVDVTKNPGCGVRVQTTEEKIERNAKIGEFIYQAYLEAPKRQYLYNWFDYGCITGETTTFNWLMKPGDSPVTFGPGPLVGDGMRTEIERHWKVMPDYGAVEGTFKQYVWDGGVTLRYVYAGHTADGKRHSTWEIDTILISDEGYITHWEFWNDTLGSDDIIFTVTGKHLLGLSMQEYIQLIQDSEHKSDEDE